MNDNGRQGNDLTRRCSEPLAAPRSGFSMASTLNLQPRASSPAVADLGIVRC